MNINELCINTIRIIGNEGINKAKSGHPGMVLGSAAIAYTIFTKHLNITPLDSKWQNRDRFVLASGHASMLLYMNLLLSGFDLTIEDIKNFRQLGSKTPGHPEYGVTDGVDCTSGPLGQGLGHAVGMAIGEKFMASTFNKDDLKIVDNYTYVLCGDGDLEEGISQEAISLAGVLKLNKLIVCYDKNNVTLDGPLSISSVEDTKARFKAANWNVLECDGLDCEAVDKCIKKAKKSEDKPTLIICTTKIGYLSSKEGDCATHGSPIGDDILTIKEKLAWPYEEFEVPTEAIEHYKETIIARGAKAYKKWKKTLKMYKMQNPSLYAEYENALNGKAFKNLKYPEFSIETSEATRVTSGKVLNALAPQVKTLIGGSADVAKSTNTMLSGVSTFGVEDSGRNMNFGIREFAMSTIQSGMLLYKGTRPFIGLFLVFTDYLKASIRTAALMGLPSINICTHDSLAVGEDGPTHQPIEHVNTLRLIPNCVTFRPAGAVEVSMAYRYAMENNCGPVNLILSRQNIKVPSLVTYEDFIKGAYIVHKEKKAFDICLLATGSEVELCEKTRVLLEQEGYSVRVVSMTSMELFDKQSEAFKESILGNDRNKVISVEMGNTGLWYKYASRCYGVNEFGASGKANDVMAHYGFTPEALRNYIVK